MKTLIKVIAFLLVAYYGFNYGANLYLEKRYIDITKQGRVLILNSEINTCNYYDVVNKKKLEKTVLTKTEERKMQIILEMASNLVNGEILIFTYDTKLEESEIDLVYLVFNSMKKVGIKGYIVHGIQDGYMSVF